MPTTDAFSHNTGFSAISNGYAIGARGAEVQVVTSGRAFSGVSLSLTSGVSATSGKFSAGVTATSLAITNNATIGGTLSASSGYRQAVHTILTSANGSTNIAHYGITGITGSSLAGGYTYYLTQPPSAGFIVTLYRDLTTGGSTGPIYVTTSGADFFGTTGRCTTLTFAGTTSNTSGPKDRVRLYAVGTTHWLLGAALTTGITST
jgi:hypothetical protein